MPSRVQGVTWSAGHHGMSLLMLFRRKRLNYRLTARRGSARRRHDEPASGGANGGQASLPMGGRPARSRLLLDPVVVASTGTPSDTPLLIWPPPPSLMTVGHSLRSWARFPPPRCLTTIPSSVGRPVSAPEQSSLSPDAASKDARRTASPPHSLWGSQRNFAHAHSHAGRNGCVSFSLHAGESPETLAFRKIQSGSFPRCLL